MDHVDHILVVDDDRDIRTGVVQYLQKNGLRATMAADGREMYTELDGNAIDLIVLDIMMPGDDGLVLARNLRCEQASGDPDASCSPRGTMKPTASSGWKWAPTITWSSRFHRVNCWRASRR